MPNAGKSFYAVHVGRNPGVYSNWDDTRAQVEGYPGARHKKFNNQNDADQFVRYGSNGVLKGSLNSNDQSDRSNGSNDPNRSTKSQNPTLAGFFLKNASGSNDQSTRTDVSEKASVVQNRTSTNDPLTIRVYCDGACSRNGQKNVLTPAGSGVWWEPNQDCPITLPANLSCRLPGPIQTNNRAELYAIYLVLKHEPDPHMKLEIYTDSQYSINCLTKWLQAWLKNDWKTSTGKPVENRDLIDTIRKQLYNRDQIHRNGTQLIYVKGHTGCLGNEEADRLARLGAEEPIIPELVLS